MIKAMTIPLLNTVPATAAQTDEVCEFAMNDPYGALMALLGMGIVFFALLMLYIIFTNTPRLYTASFKAKLKELSPFRKKPEVVAIPEASQKEKLDHLTGEVNAAIAAAIHLYRFELHDFEDTVLTIKKVSRTYSPWSSKIYGLRNNLGRN
jgi:glutaconyl-CoA/methylmalonyl-CoA decarboxylase subunit delta